MRARRESGRCGLSDHFNRVAIGVTSSCVYHSRGSGVGPYDWVRPTRRPTPVASSRMRSGPLVLRASGGVP
jgi:hypothetical protein